MNTSFGDRSFAAAAPHVWNSLPDAVRNSVLSEDAFCETVEDIPYELYVGRGAFDVELAPLNKLIIIIIIIIWVVVLLYLFGRYRPVVHSDHADQT